jgi:hypothetical protein
MLIFLPSHRYLINDVINRRKPNEGKYAYLSHLISSVIDIIPNVGKINTRKINHPAKKLLVFFNEIRTKDIIAKVPTTPTKTLQLFIARGEGTG